MEKDEISKGLSVNDLAGSCAIGVNSAGTRDENDTRLTQARSPGVHGWTYFIRIDDAIKIGFASNFKKRISSLQTSHQKPIEVLAVVPASLVDEFKTHQLFAHLRIRGEWFQNDQELIYFIEGAKAAAANLTSAPAPARESTKVDETRIMIGRLAEIRKAYGSDTPMGRACSNLAEQLPHMAEYVRPSWASHEIQTLPWMIQQQMKRIEALKAASN